MTPGPRERSRAVAVIFATVVMTAGLALREELGVWLATGIAAAVAGGAVVLVERDRLARWLAPTAPALALGVLGGIAMALATHLLYAPLVEAVPAAGTEVRQLYRVIDAPPGAAAALPVVLFVIVAEELVWRGAVIDLLSSRFGSATTVALAALAYVIPQIGIGSWLLALVALGGGLFWGTLRRWTGSVTAPLVAHVLWDVAVFVLLPLAPPA